MRKLTVGQNLTSTKQMKKKGEERERLPNLLRARNHHHCPKIHIFFYLTIVSNIKIKKKKPLSAK
jgi:hypothetical protein